MLYGNTPRVELPENATFQFSVLNCRRITLFRFLGHSSGFSVLGGVLLVELLLRHGTVVVCFVAAGIGNRIQFPQIRQQATRRLCAQRIYGVKDIQRNGRVAWFVFTRHASFKALGSYSLVRPHLGPVLGKRVLGEGVGYAATDCRGFGIDLKGLPTKADGP